MKIMYPIRDLTGLRFGFWRVLRFSHKGKSGLYWFCRCGCGAERAVNGADLKKRQSRSCGCKIAEETRKAIQTHKMTRTPTYRSWADMKTRCTNPARNNYHNYGGRGIHFCERWGSFENFLQDMGIRPKGTSLDRINNDGNYEPGNCRWASRKEQNANKRCCILVTQGGISKTVAALAKEVGMSPMTLARRIKSGWPVDLAIKAKPYFKLNHRQKCKSVIQRVAAV